MSVDAADVGPRRRRTDRSTRYVVQTGGMDLLATTVSAVEFHRLLLGRVAMSSPPSSPSQPTIRRRSTDRTESSPGCPNRTGPSSMGQSVDVERSEGFGSPLRYRRCAATAPRTGARTVATKLNVAQQTTFRPSRRRGRDHAPPGVLLSRALCATSVGSRPSSGKGSAANRRPVRSARYRRFSKNPQRGTRCSFIERSLLDDV